MKSFAVLPEFQGKAFVGTTLLRTMSAELKKIGITKVKTIPTERSWNILRDHGYDYPSAMKAELRIRNLDETAYTDGATLVKRL